MARLPEQEDLDRGELLSRNAESRPSAAARSDGLPPQRLHESRQGDVRVAFCQPSRSRREYGSAALVVASLLAVVASMGLHNFVYARAAEKAGLRHTGMYRSDLRSYGPIARESAQGRWSPTEYCLFEGREEDRPFTWPPLANAVVAAAVRLSGGVDRAFMALDFALPLIAFLLALVLGRRLLGGTRIAVFLAVLAATLSRFDVGDYIPNLQPALREIEQRSLDPPAPRPLLSVVSETIPYIGKATETSTPPWPRSTRLHAPLLTNVFMLVGLLALAWMAARPDRTIAWVSAAAACALNLYVYYHNAVFLFFTLCVLTLLTSLPERPGWKRPLLTAGCYVFVAIPFLWNYWRLLQCDWYDPDYLQRVGVKPVQEIVFGGRHAYGAWLLMGLGVLLACRLATGPRAARSCDPAEGPRGGDPLSNGAVPLSNDGAVRRNARLLLALVAAFFLSINVHLFTRTYLHVDKFFSGPFLIPQLLVCVWVFWMIVRDVRNRLTMHRRTRTCITAIVALYLVSVAAAQLGGIVRNSLLAADLLAQDEGVRHVATPAARAVVDHLSATAGGGPKVVLSLDRNVNAAVLSFTSAKVFLPWSFGTVASNHEIEDRLLIAASVYGIPASRLGNLANAMNIDLFGYRFGGYGHGVPGTFVEELELRYKAVPQGRAGSPAGSADLESLLGGRKLDWVVVSTQHTEDAPDSWTDPAAVAAWGFEPVHTTEAVAIYGRTSAAGAAGAIATD